MEYPVTAKLCVATNPQGAYSCPPDEVACFEDGKVKIVAKLLALADGRVAYGVDYKFADAGSSGPIFWASSQTSPDGDRVSAIVAIRKILVDICDKAEEKGVNARILGALEDWADNFPEKANWQPPNEESPSRRGRKPVEPQTTDRPEFDEAETNAVMVAAAEWDSNARALAKQVGYQLPAESTNPDLICRDIAANMRRSLESVLEIGRGLLVLKAVCAHGDFMGRLEFLGIDQRLANRFMAAGMKFSKWTSTSTLLPKIESQTKLFELLVLDDEQIDELAENGQTGELKLDEVACMGVRELRKAVRDLRAKADAKDKVIKNKQGRITELEDLLDAVPDEEEQPEPDTTQPKLLTGLITTVETIEQLAIRLEVQIRDIRSVIAASPYRTAHERAALMRCLAAIRTAAIVHDIPLAADASDEEVEPEFGEEEIHRKMLTQLRARNQGKNNEATGA
jgi:hypothetical protein